MTGISRHRTRHGTVVVVCRIGSQDRKNRRYLMRPSYRRCMQDGGRGERVLHVIILCCQATGQAGYSQACFATHLEMLNLNQLSVHDCTCALYAISARDDSTTWMPAAVNPADLPGCLTNMKPCFTHSSWASSMFLRKLVYHLTRLMCPLTLVFSSTVWMPAHSSLSGS